MAEGLHGGPVNLHCLTYSCLRYPNIANSFPGDLLPSGIVLLSLCPLATLLQSWKASDQLERTSCVGPELVPRAR